MEPYSAFVRLLEMLSLDAPSREWTFGFSGLFVIWVLTELFIGRPGVNALSLASDRGSAFATALAGAGGVALGFAMGSLRWLPFQDVWARWLGLGVMAAGLALRVFAILWLGPMFTRFVQIVPGHRLVTNGPYRFMRHPSYSGLLLFFVGMGMALGDWLSVLALVGLPLVGIMYRIKVEEEALLRAFGDAYGAYMERVPRLVPFVM